MYISPSDCVSLVNLTMVGNYAGAGGGAVFNHTSNSQLHNSILWDNAATSGAQIGNTNSVTPLTASAIFKIQEEVEQDGIPAWERMAGTISTPTRCSSILRWDGLA